MTTTIDTDAPETRAPSATLAVLKRAGVVGALVAAAVAVALVQSGSGIVVWQSVVTGLLTGGLYGLIAMGLTLIFGVLDIVNFAHGAMLAVAMFISFGVVAVTGLHPYLTMLITVPALFLVGVLVHRGLLSGSGGATLENQLLITLGLSLLLENGLLLFFGAEPKNVGLPGETHLDVFGAVVAGSRLYAFLGAMALGLLLYWMLQHTRLGTAIRAVASNSAGAELVGINVRRIHTLTFAIGAACAGAAAALAVPLLSVTPTLGEQFNITAFVVVVLGGMGNVVGALVGGLLIGLVEQLTTIYLDGQSSLLGVFVVFVLVLFLRPQGLFGRRT
ncbi:MULTISPECIES: branched-chain amino acid ABC transporter permease [Prauserella salsuginis group]|uniref:Branched-chain amino acid transport system permease protein n=2 Tax=Prauserella salsuginis group TaxID=2893672 RepID=A0A839XW85_9PSEU|nr:MULTISPECIES: branched-chain amino acid ABC transporter permease [Prauserella salsuginis group]MBB3664763.1 branched-chain amino acid transport system permease protein [Prauserella sediminis]MCR3722229.1 branched-chain amino acid transport system permease protein [Prauserella flava]MCR3736227.1 branched-chain amino acid transport system permease protein [Prauserella salsuginis]